MSRAIWLDLDIGLTWAHSVAVSNLHAPLPAPELMRSPTLVRYGEGLIAHGQHGCPEGYGRVHPMIQRDTWRAWQWYGGGLIDRWIHYSHRMPGVRRLICAVWCARYERYRGPWAPLVRDTFPIPWPRSLHPERQARYARFESRGQTQDPD